MIDQIREKYPQYQDLSDQQLADKVYQKFYSDMDRGEFDQKVGVAAPADEGSGLLDKAAVGIGGLIEGIPVAGPLIRGGVERAAAATDAAFSDRTYDQNMKFLRRDNARIEQENPMLDTGAKITGAIGGTIPMVMAAPAAFGAGAGPLAGRMLASGATSGALGAADAAVRSGGDPDAIKSGAMWGAGLGTAGPAVAAGVGKVAGSIMDRVRARSVAPKAQQSALRKVGKAYAEDAVANPAQYGKEGMLVDMGPRLQGQGGVLASGTSPGRSIIRDALAQRQAGATGRVTGSINRNVNPKVSGVAERAAQAEIRTTKASPLYEAAKRHPEPLNSAGIVDMIDDSMKSAAGKHLSALKRIRRQMFIKGAGASEEAAEDSVKKYAGRHFAGLEQPGVDKVAKSGKILKDNAEGLHNIRSELSRYMANEGRDVAGRMKPILNAMDEELDSIPGYREARKIWAGSKALDDALDEGGKVFTKAVAPDELTERVLAMKPAVREAFRKGARKEIEALMGTARNEPQKAWAILHDQGWNREKLNILLGSEKASALIKDLGIEKTFADTASTVTRNSETASRVAGAAEFASPDVGGRVRTAFEAGGSQGALRAAGLKKLENVINSVVDSDRTATEAAKMLVATGPERDKVIQALARMRAVKGSNAKSMAAIEKITRAIMAPNAPTVGQRR